VFRIVRLSLAASQQVSEQPCHLMSGFDGKHLILKPEIHLTQFGTARVSHDTLRQPITALVGHTSETIPMSDCLMIAPH
jgi:hypothetical protein